MDINNLDVEELEIHKSRLIEVLADVRELSKAYSIEMILQLIDSIEEKYQKEGQNGDDR